MKKYYENSSKIFISVFVSLLFFVTFSVQQSLAAGGGGGVSGTTVCGSTSCHCQSPNDPKNTNINCASTACYIQMKIPQSCTLGEVCTDGSNGIPTCTKSNTTTVQSCSCTNSGKEGPGNNGITCTDNQGNKQVDGKYCKSTQVCNNKGTSYSCDDLGCTCENPNATGAGNNGMKCGSSQYEVFGAITQMCTGAAGHAQFTNISCTCDYPNSKAAGQNTYKCVGGVTDSCQKQQICTQSGTTISCQFSADAGNGAQIPQSISAPPPPCANASTNSGGCASVDTALGNWSTDPAGFVRSLFGYLLSISGAIAVLIIIFAGYKMMMSQGDPEKIAGAKEQMTAAIIGLLFLIFSLVILQVIGVDILHLPGFSGSNSTGTATATGTGTGTGSSGSGGTPTPNPALDATACQQIASNPQCGFNGGGTGLFCGQSGSATNCGIQGNVGTLYTCDSTGKTVSFQRCPNLDCVTAIGAINADYCGSGTIKHYSCQSNGLCQEDPNGQYTTGNCNNACN